MSVRIVVAHWFQSHPSPLHIVAVGSGPDAMLEAHTSDATGNVIVTLGQLQMHGGTGHGSFSPGPPVPSHVVVKEGPDQAIAPVKVL
jgi:hypothetical protein